jgi:hypothetical protein
MPHAVVDATVKEGRDTWYFIAADYAFGHSLESDAASFVTGAGAKVVGVAEAPFPGTTDFSLCLVQEKASGSGYAADRAILLEHERSHAGVCETFRPADARERSPIGACRAILGSGAFLKTAPWWGRTRPLPADWR